VRSPRAPLDGGRATVIYCALVRNTMLDDPKVYWFSEKRSFAFEGLTRFRDYEAL
jgi:hypothetical protein